MNVRNMAVFYGEDVLASRSTPSWRIIPCRLSATAYSIYTQLPSIVEAFLHPQPEEAPCRGDRDPHITAMRHFY